MGLRIYSVLVKPGAPAESARFVRDGFHFWAFVLTVVWRPIRVFGSPALLFAPPRPPLALAGQALHWPPAGPLPAGLGPPRRVGLGPAAWYRATLERRGWVEAAVIAAPNRDTAEQRFAEIARTLRT